MKDATTPVGECGHTPDHIRRKIITHENHLADVERMIEAVEKFMHEHGASSYERVCADSLCEMALNGIGRR